MPNFKDAFHMLAITCALGLSVLCDTAAAAGSYFANKTVGVIRPPDGRPCTFFWLDGVSPADPATPGVSWMVLRQAQTGYKENLAVLMSAKLTGRTVNVTTNGVPVSECSGTVEAYVVELP